ncbi:chemotaxis protein CheD [Clostridiales bacterium PH28_bin88]|nr:chemotaxis protein CheD [Clostridiales bacterium PH28_bin88]
MGLLTSGADIKVGIADWKVAHNPVQIITLGLGSCVGITLYDPTSKIGGLAHIMLPDSSQFPGYTNPAKFADLAIPLMVEEMLRRGARIPVMQAKIAGGAQMFSFPEKQNSTLNVGARNVAMTREALRKIGIRLLAEDTGGNYGRTMILNTDDGGVFIRTVGSPIKKL